MIVDDSATFNLVCSESLSKTSPVTDSAACAARVGSRAAFRGGGGEEEEAQQCRALLCPAIDQTERGVFGSNVKYASSLHPALLRLHFLSLCPDLLSNFQS